MVLPGQIDIGLTRVFSAAQEVGSHGGCDLEVACDPDGDVQPYGKRWCPLIEEQAVRVVTTVLGGDTRPSRVMLEQDPSSSDGVDRPAVHTSEPGAKHCEQDALILSARYLRPA